MSKRSRASHNRGYISLSGSTVSTITNNPLYNDYRQNFTNENVHHLTLLDKAETKALLEKLDGSLPDLDSIDIDIVDLGLGGKNGVLFNVICWPGGSKFRRMYGLKAKEFHITLTKTNDHEINKSYRSLILAKSLSSEDVNLILSQEEAWKDESFLRYLYNFVEMEKIFYRISQDNMDLIIKAIRSHSDWNAPLVRYAEVATNVCDYKSAMILYLLVWSRKDSKNQKLMKFLENQFKKLSQKTEWGLIYTEEEMNHFLSMPQSEREEMEKVIDKLNMKTMTELVATIEMDQPTLSKDSRERTFAYIPESRSFFKLPRFFSWIVPFKLCCMSTPRNEADIDVLSGFAFHLDTIVTLTEEEPLPNEWFQKKSVKNIFIPVPNYKAPTIAQVMTIIDVIVESNKRTLVHCGGGKGRAGTVLACYICACGFTTRKAESPVYAANDAIRIIRSIRPGSIETEEQEQFITSFVSHLWKNMGSSTASLIQEPKHTVVKIDGVFDPKASLIVCCGLQGSGKSHFSLALQERTGWERVSQDEIGTKDAVLGEVANLLKRKKKVIVDRCNPTMTSRKDLLGAAFYPKDATCIYFDYPIELCIHRADKRTNHPVIRQGRSATPIKSTAKAFQLPSLKEGFACIISVTSFDSALQLLSKFPAVGVNRDNANNEEENEEKEFALQESDATTRITLIKFPRTRHLYNMGSASRDDLICHEKDAERFLNCQGTSDAIVLQEKVDGANLGISINPETLQFLVQNRSHYVTSKSHVQYKKLDKWLQDHREDLWTILGSDDTDVGRYILYGEWLVATHSIPYTMLPDHFLAFDLYDTHQKRFLSTKRLKEILQDTFVKHVPEISATVSGRDDFVRLMKTKSFYYDGYLEGVYVRRENEDYVVDRAKVVRADFICGNEFWAKGMISFNQIDISSRNL